MTSGQLAPGKAGGQEESLLCCCGRCAYQTPLASGRKGAPGTCGSTARLGGHPHAAMKPSCGSASSLLSNLAFMLGLTVKCDLCLLGANMGFVCGEFLAYFLSSWMERAIYLCLFCELVLELYVWGDGQQAFLATKSLSYPKGNRNP